MSHAAKYESEAARKARSARSARYSSVSDSQSRTRSNHAWSVVSVAAWVGRVSARVLARDLGEDPAPGLHRGTGVRLVEAHAHDPGGGAAVGEGRGGAVEPDHGAVRVVRAVRRARQPLPHAEGEVDGIVRVLPRPLPRRQPQRPVVGPVAVRPPAGRAVPGPEVDLDEAGQLARDVRGLLVVVAGERRAARVPVTRVVQLLLGLDVLADDRHRVRPGARGVLQRHQCGRRPSARSPTPTGRGPSAWGR